MKVPIIKLQVGDKFRSFPKYPEEEIIEITEDKIIVKLHNGAITEYDKKGLVHVIDATTLQRLQSSSQSPNDQ